MEIQHPLWSGTTNQSEKVPALIDPPLLNSANPWATTLEDLEKIYLSEYTGAVTTRTTLLDGFKHDDSIHQYVFFNPRSHASTKSSQTETGSVGSLNTLGYSPLPLSAYLNMIKSLNANYSKPDHKAKPIIISVTGSPEEVRKCALEIAATQKDVHMPLLMEINLSCPNIADKPPPAYSADRLADYLAALADTPIPIGLKTPPYTYSDQFRALVDALSQASKSCRVSFITATNTLGSSLVLQPAQGGFAPAINSSTGSGIGGMAGAPLHPLALGNVKTLHEMLSSREELRRIQIIGVGGVSDGDGFRRMRSVGAAAVAVGTGLGMKGVGVFKDIMANPEES